KGMTWAPAYRLSIEDEKNATLSMSAIIRNEMAPFKDAEINLISGFPNIEFANRTSLIVPGATLASFFQGLSNPRGGRGVMSQITSNIRSPRDMDDDYDLPKASAEESSMDIHYREIGKLTMDVGETLYLPLEQAETPFDRVVEWSIPDHRDEYGRAKNPENKYGEFWDTLRFRNPFKSPLTTAPVEITDGAKVLGQSTLAWVNPGQETSVKITKALSISGDFEENEGDQNLPVVIRGSRRYRNPDIQGEFRVKNHRGVPTKICVRLRISGEYLSSSVDLESRHVLDMGFSSANKRQELTWMLTLAPGEEQTVNYHYSVLIAN
ncbi:MAG: DUF4139 domain-containing protein, partial [Kiritimatiellaeota bacterium]|nr:DUF4139 domain-containing protein [Kiritimatiellota bacterium]